MAGEERKIWGGNQREGDERDTDREGEGGRETETDTKSYLKLNNLDWIKTKHTFLNI